MTHDWSADLIAPDEDFAGAPLLRKEFALDPGHGAVVGATLFVTAHGIVEPTINGTPVSDEVLTPGWTSYEWRLRYRSYDVTPLVSDTSVLGLALGNGWFRGRLGWSGKSGFYGSELAGLAELHVEFEDGHRQLVGTDATWQAGPSATLVNDLYDGQTIDARLGSSDWTQPGAALEGWSGVHAVAHDGGRLEPYFGPPVRRQEVVRAGEGVDLPGGSDAGRLRAEPGRLAPLLRAGRGRQRDHGPPCRGARARRARHPAAAHRRGDRPLHPQWAASTPSSRPRPSTVSGMPRSSGWPGELTAGSLEAVVVHSELERTGTFECPTSSSTSCTATSSGASRGTSSTSPPTARNATSGWAGPVTSLPSPPPRHTSTTSPASSSNWLVDVDLEQSHADGMVPFVVPDVLKYMEHPADFPDPDSTAVWSDAAAWVPWALWRPTATRRPSSASTRR